MNAKKILVFEYFSSRIHDIASYWNPSDESTSLVSLLKGYGNIFFYYFIVKNF
jgi:hypothetical protein